MPHAVDDGRHHSNSKYFAQLHNRSRGMLIFSMRQKKFISGPLSDAEFCPDPKLSYDTFSRKLIVALKLSF